MSDRFDLEQAIMEAGVTSSDLKLAITEMIDGDTDFTEDNFMNIVGGIMELHNLRMAKVIRTLESMIENDQFK